MVVCPVPYGLDATFNGPWAKNAYLSGFLDAAFKLRPSVHPYGGRSVTLLVPSYSALFLFYFQAFTFKKLTDYTKRKLLE